LRCPFIFVPIAEARVSCLAPGGPSPTNISDGKTAASISTNVALQSAVGAASLCIPNPILESRDCRASRDTYRAAHRTDRHGRPCTETQGQRRRSTPNGIGPKTKMGEDQSAIRTAPIFSRQKSRWSEKSRRQENPGEEFSKGSLDRDENRSLAGFALAPQRFSTTP